MNKYLDRTGDEITAGDIIQDPDGITMQVYPCMDQHGNEDLGILANNPAYMRNHPDYPLEFYSLNQIRIWEWEIVNLAAPIDR